MALIPAEFTGLFIRHRAMLSAYVLTLVRDPGRAEDILQDVAMNLMEKFKSFDGRDFGGWARTVARWHVMNHWRGEFRYQRALKEKVVDLLDEQYHECETRYGNWEAHKEALYRCLEALGETARRMLEMRYVDGLALAGIAKRIGKRAGAVQMTLTRTKDRLADCVRRRLAIE